MKDRIKELADEAGFMSTFFSESGDDMETEIRKFAKLLIDDLTTTVSRTVMQDKYESEARDPHSLGWNECTIYLTKQLKQRYKND